MRADITALLVVVVSLTTGLTNIGAGARKVSPGSTRTKGGAFLYEVVPGNSLVTVDLFFFGSTTHRVIPEARCAVLTVRG